MIVKKANPSRLPTISVDASYDLTDKVKPLSYVDETYELAASSKELSSIHGASASQLNPGRNLNSNRTNEGSVWLASQKGGNASKQLVDAQSKENQNSINVNSMNIS